MIYIPIIIVITTILIDLYLTSHDRFEYFQSNNIITEPWDKIEKSSIGSKYYININSLNLNNKYIKKLNVWQELTLKNKSDEDYNPISIEDDSIVFDTIRESDALVLCNLVINNLNNNITMEEIVKDKLIKKTINKAKKYDLVCIKLRELINEGLTQLNKDDTIDLIDTNDTIEIDTNEIDTNDTIEIENIEEIKNDIINNDIINNIDNNEYINKVDTVSSTFGSKFIPYEGSEYATINF